MGPTIHDVARLANTSKSTVSRYLNGQKVKQETQEALDRAIKELNFHINANARRLVMDKTYTIGVIIDDISNTFYSGIIKGIEYVANKQGYNCIFLSWTSNYNKEISFLKLLYEGQVDGIIMVSFKKRNVEDLEEIRKLSFPIALVGDNGEMEGLLSVDVDNAAGVADAVTYLHGIGHRQIAYIAGPVDAAASKYRFKGYKQTVESLGLPYNPEWVVQSDWTNRGGFTAAQELIAKKGITAIVASNDETAIGALHALQEQGIRVPGDISVVGFDDIPVASWVYPTLTTIRQPFRDLGMIAAEGLFHEIEGKKNERRLHLLKPQLIVRDSCKNLEQKGVRE